MKTTLIIDHIVQWLDTYLESSGLNGFVIGVSGGIDSAVTLAIATEALGANNMIVALMPSKFSSDHSIKDAEDLANKMFEFVQLKRRERIALRYKCEEESLHFDWSNLGKYYDEAYRKVVEL